MKYGLKVLEIDTIEVEKRSEFTIFDIDEINEFSTVSGSNEIDVELIKKLAFDDLFKVNSSKKTKVCLLPEIMRYIEEKITFIDSDFIICLRYDLHSMDLIIYGDLDTDDEENYFDVFIYEPVKSYNVYGPFGDEGEDDEETCIAVEDVEKYLDNLDIIISKIKNVLNK